MARKMSQKSTKVAQKTPVRTAKPVLLSGGNTQIGDGRPQSAVATRHQNPRGWARVNVHRQRQETLAVARGFGRRLFTLSSEHRSTRSCV